MDKNLYQLQKGGIYHGYKNLCYLTEYNPPHFHEITCITQSYKLQTKSLCTLQLHPEQST